MSSICISDKEINRYDILPGDTILRILQRNRFYIDAPCGGNGTCGKCMVELHRNGQVLVKQACTTTAEDGDVVYLSSETYHNSFLRCKNGTYNNQHSTGWGAAIDLGTTTIAIRLINLSNSSIVGELIDWNSQRLFGSDVITRAQRIVDFPGEENVLQELTLDQISGMLGLLCTQQGILTSDVSKVIVAGNTLMQHLLFNVDPRPVLYAPYFPKERFQNMTERYTRSIPNATIFPTPCISGYVGGDIVAGILSVGLTEGVENNLLIDIGTNGEMVLGSQSGLLCCSVATGPAFEGAEISCGMANTNGAICHVRLCEDDIVPKVTGDSVIKGICGSGLIELLAILLDLGIVDDGGRLQTPEDLEDEDIWTGLPEKIQNRLAADKDENGIFYLSEDKTVYLSTADVRKLQLAKAAIAAGVQMLFINSKLSPEEIDNIYIAGGFGGNLDVISAIKIGMIPQLPLEKYKVVGNSALDGATNILTDNNAVEKIEHILGITRYIELSGNSQFSELFINSITFA